MNYNYLQVKMKHLYFVLGLWSVLVQRYVSEAAGSIDQEQKETLSGKRLYYQLFLTVTK